MGEENKIPVLKLMAFIVDWQKLKIINEVFDKEHVRFHFFSKGRGTASSEILDLLGIGASDKAVVLCIEQDGKIPALLKGVRKKLGFHSPGAGIAFTIPLSGINNPILKIFKDQILKDFSSTEIKETATMGSEVKHDLILSVINRGYSDEFMTLARESGATGGTVINARGQTHEGAVKFFGVSVQEERELILILTNREKKAAIMQAVSQAYGLTTKAGGIVFSLPVDRVMGLSIE
jgi:nitrogen regulatory protein PII